MSGHQSDSCLPASLDEASIAGKTVLTRVDLNLPTRHSKITDPTRAERILPTLRNIVERGGKPVLMSHFGRPDGKFRDAFSFRTYKQELSDILGFPVRVIDWRDPDRESEVVTPAEGIDLLENLRFHPGEEANSPDFARHLARFGDIYCNDAFSVSHRAHASVSAICQFLPGFTGRLMEAELYHLYAAAGQPDRPMAALVGGAKISTKLPILENLINKADYLIVGGAMANTFLLEQGFGIGRSLAEASLVDVARRIRLLAAESGCRLVLPLDIVVAAALKPGAVASTRNADECPSESMILDFGPRACAGIGSILGSCRTLVWNGPLGAFEVPPFDTATCTVARMAARLCREGSLTAVAGGGDTVSALKGCGHAEGFTYLSSAGGAFLAWIEGKMLPGIAALLR